MMAERWSVRHGEGTIDVEKAKALEKEKRKRETQHHGPATTSFLFSARLGKRKIWSVRAMI
jgi:hypothetical protein